MEEEQNETRMKRHTRVATINSFIREAERMSKEIMTERRDKSDSFNAASFSSAMNWLTAGHGLRVLTKGDMAYAELLFGPITV